ncbi:MAG TPA: O-sialoglycoprotein endopeptidase, partial [Bacillota bacterium]|nr:O-sialoglycoprotein endopeptidase [Bacillota bacterium]
MDGKAERRLFLGLDTSAYTTAVALVDREERLIWEKRLLLPVKEGALGLRQSEAVFAHLQNLPRLWAEGAAFLKNASLEAVAAATRPRPVEGSYMPVFKVSEAFGIFTAQTL